MEIDNSACMIMPFIPVYIIVANDLCLTYTRGGGFVPFLISDSLPFVSWMRWGKWQY